MIKNECTVFELEAGEPNERPVAEYPQVWAIAFAHDWVIWRGRKSWNSREEKWVELLK